MHITITADGDQRFEGSLDEFVTQITACGTEFEKFLGEAPKESIQIHLVFDPHISLSQNIIMFKITKEETETFVNGSYDRIRGMFQTILDKVKEDVNDPTITNLIKAMRSTVPVKGTGCMTIEFETGTMRYDNSRLVGTMVIPMGLDMMKGALGG